MKIKNITFIIIYFFFIFILVDVFANIFKIRPLLWKNSFYTYLNVGWYTWFGADHLYEKKEIHNKQTNGYKTRGLKPDKNFSKNIILLGDSSVETSHRLNEMPEKYLRDRLSKTNVITFGSWGWSTDQQLLHLQKYIKDIKPQKIILWFEMNDIAGNITKHGFMGRKPIFKIKKDNGEHILSGPDISSEKNYFEYSYFYRVLNKIIDYSLAKKDKNFLEIAKNCTNNKKYTDKKVIAKLLNNKDFYDQSKKIHNHHEKPYRNKVVSKEYDNIFPSFEKWQENKIDNFFKIDASKTFIGQGMVNLDPFKLQAENQIDNALYAEILTNKLLNKIQLLANKNEAEFYAFVVYQKSLHEPFNKNEKVFVCYNNKELAYSNKAFQNKMKKIFKNIKNVAMINLEGKFTLENNDGSGFIFSSYGDGNFGPDYYDFFDAHKNNAANEYIMKEVHKFINE